ncbi:MAG: dephospho-CoA kinase, partial [Aurantimicrobium sp.]
MKLIGLTGGIGSGKSTIARRLADHGAVIIDADQVARDVVEPGQPALEAIFDALGQDLRQPDGSLNR